jgi:hypothetical protein
MLIDYAIESSLGQQIFGNTPLGDSRRTERLVTAFDQMCKHPGDSLPAKMADPPQLRALYRLCNHPQTTHAVLVEAARGYTLRRIEACQHPVLIVHDDTELDYTTLESLRGQLGQIGTGSRCGYICHNSIAVDANTGEVLGLVDQILHHRVKAPKQETLQQHRERSSRESLLWLRGTAHLPGNPQLIDVTDRGSDTFEYLEHEIRSGRRFVVRATKTRKVHAGHTRTGDAVYLKEFVAGLPELGHFTMNVQAQKKRVARKNAAFSVRAAALLVDPPHAKWGVHGDDPLPLYAVVVTEITPPAGEKPIEWILYTNEPTTTLAVALEVIGWYKKRWIVEELHKGKKTGVQTEAMQFATTAALEPAIALLTVLALTLLNLRDASRQADAQTRPATSLLPRDYVLVLSQWRYGELRPLSIHDFFYALARLGGHQNRSSDSRPGWLILWRGWTRLQSMSDGYEAAQRQRCGKT